MFDMQLERRLEGFTAMSFYLYFFALFIGFCKNMPLCHQIIDKKVNMYTFVFIERQYKTVAVDIMLNTLKSLHKQRELTTKNMSINTQYSKTKYRPKC